MEAQQLATAICPCARLLAASGMLLMLAGCASTPSTNPPPPATGEATWLAVTPPGTRHYQLALGDVSSGATLEQMVAPTYPPDLLASCPAPVQVQALVIVGTSGAVTEVRVAGENTADATRGRFIGAVRVAALRWQFVPLQVTHWAADADADGNSHQVDSGARPFSLTYQFHFACHAGKPAVTTSPAVPP